MKHHRILSTREVAIELAIAHRRDMERKGAVCKVKRWLTFAAWLALAAMIAVELIGMAGILNEHIRKGNVL